MKIGVFPFQMILLSPFTRAELCTINFSIIKKILKKEKSPLLKCHCYQQLGTQTRKVRLQQFKMITCSFEKYIRDKKDETSKFECRFWIKSSRIVHMLSWSSNLWQLELDAKLNSCFTWHISEISKFFSGIFKCLALGW